MRACRLDATASRRVLTTPYSGAQIDNQAAMGRRSAVVPISTGNLMKATLLLPVLLGVAGALSLAPTAAAAQGASSADAATARALLDRYCVTCHNGRLRTAGLELDAADPAAVGESGHIWEQVARKLRASAPCRLPGRPRPEREDALALVSYLETTLDGAAAAKPARGPHRDFPPPQPGRVPQCRPRPAAGRRGRLGAAAGRRFRRARLRQHGCRPVGLAGAARAVPVCGAQDQPACGRLRASRAERRHAPCPRCCCTRTSGSARTCRSARAAVSRFGTVSPWTASTTIRLRLQRTYTDYIRGLGTPQHLDVRIDGRLNRAVHGRWRGPAPHATAAPASFAGNTPLFGHPDWEQYVLGADEDLVVTLSRGGRGRASAWWASRSSASCGSPRACCNRARQDSRSPSTSAGRANAAIGSVEIGGPYAEDGPGNTHQPADDLHVPPGRGR